MHPLAVCSHSGAPQLSPRLIDSGENGGVAIEAGPADISKGTAALMDALGANEGDFVDPFILQLINAVSKGAAVDEDQSGFMLAVVRGLEPRD